MANLQLALFFTRGMSLQAWEQIGMLDREIALYQQLQKQDVRVGFVTYGNVGELKYTSQLSGIKILCNRGSWPGVIYEKLLPLLHAGWLRHSQVIKTNQVNGAEVALRAARLWRKPLIARCGYMWSDQAAQGGPDRAAEVKQARRLEARVFSAANQVVVTTPALRDYVVENYDQPSAKIKVIPNYVLTDLFSPDSASGNPVPNLLCSVGRLSQLKNPQLLIRACAGLDVELAMVGDGPLRPVVEELAAELKVRLRLIGNLPHRELPRLLNQAAIFLLTSQIEGHPKALLEAMSCGLPVIGVDSPGIRELICHQENGWLCSADENSIRAAIQELLAQPHLRAKLGRNARRFVVENFAFERVIEMELSVLRELCTASAL